MIIGLAGKKQVGKSTAAKFLCDAGFVSMSFVEPMKQMVCPMLMGMGLSFDDVQFFEKHKEEVMPVVGVTMRHLLQTLGTDWGRKLIHPDVWVMAASRRIDALLAAGANVVIEDVRFENEAEFIRERGGSIFHVDRLTGYQDAHASESGIKLGSGDLVVYNNDNLEHYRKVVLSLVES